MHNGMCYFNLYVMETNFKVLTQFRHLKPSSLFVVLFLFLLNGRLCVTTESEVDLRALDSEANSTGGVFLQAWKKSRVYYLHPKQYKIKGVKEYGHVLSQAEMRIIICYTFEIPGFYRKLNSDIRNNFDDLTKQTYPQATRVLTNALRKLRKVQDIPHTLYRNEIRKFVLHVYRAVQESGNAGVLKQFTSTTTRFEAAKIFNTDPDRIITTLKLFDAGAEIEDFSDYTEEEVLVPPHQRYLVENIIDGNVTLVASDSGHVRNACRYLLLCVFSLEQLIASIHN